MTITFTNNTITSNASEQTIFNTTADEHFAFWLYTHNMAVGDSITIKIYVLDQTASTLRLYDTIVLTDVQSNPAYYIPWLPARQYKVTIQRTAGTDRAYTWLSAEVT